MYYLLRNYGGRTALFLALLFQFTWQIFLNEDTELNTKNDLINFTVYSTVQFLMIVAYLIRTAFKGGNERFISIFFITLFWMIWWSLSVYDTLEYPRNYVVTYARYTGFITTLLVCIFSFWYEKTHITAH